MMIVLAPMDDVTDTVFRRIISDCTDSDDLLTVTEFVNVDGLCSPGRERLMPKLSTKQDKAPVIAQIWGKKPENFKQIANEIADGTIPGFSGIDLNFGCPDKAVLKNECCSALAKPELRDKALEIIKATQEGAGKLPVSFKTRLGFDKIDYSWHELLLQQKPSMLTVHVRTTRQMSKVPAEWAAIEPIVQLRDKISPSTKIILNGDIMNRQQGEELAQKHKVDGIMIGRGVFKNPFCFADNSKARPWNEVLEAEKVKLFRKHLTLFQETYSEGERKFNPLKKFAKIYISDFSGAAEFRDKIMHTASVTEAIKTLTS